MNGKHGSSGYGTGRAVAETRVRCTDRSLYRQVYSVAPRPRTRNRDTRYSRRDSRESPRLRDAPPGASKKKRKRVIYPDQASRTRISHISRRSWRVTRNAHRLVRRAPLSPLRLGSWKVETLNAASMQNYPGGAPQQRPDFAGPQLAWLASSRGRRGNSPGRPRSKARRPPWHLQAIRGRFQ